MIWGFLSLLEIDFLDKWAPFHLMNGSCATSDLNVDKKKINKTFNPWFAFHLNLTFGA